MQQANSFPSSAARYPFPLELVQIFPENLTEGASLRCQAADRVDKEKRKTIQGEDVVFALDRSAEKNALKHPLFRC